MYFVTNICICHVCVQDNDGWTPLHLACLLGRRDVVQALLELGADIHLRDNDHQTPADLAFHTKHRDIAEDLDPEQYKQDWQVNDFPTFVDMISSH